MRPRRMGLLALLLAGMAIGSIGCEAGGAAAPTGASSAGEASSPAASPSASPDPAASPSAPPAEPATPEPSPSPSPQAETAIYRGPVEHLFFHPLVAFPELAFDGDRISKGYDDWFVTVPEFQAMLAALYERNYALIDIRKLYVPGQDQDGLPTASAASFSFPKGKKPLVLSVDDINYYDYMRQNGNAWKLVPDTDGRITAWAKTPEGEEKTSRAWELVPILDDFVREHPDFSWQGAKGVLALTGYEGVLGYRTNEPDSPTYAEDKKDAEDVIRRLKESGWTFASHSWGHVDVNKVSLDRLKQDAAKWKNEVEPLVGPTDVFVYPYGSSVKADDPKIAYLRSQGFAVFCSVGPAPYKAFKNGIFMMDRRHIDGMALRTQRARLEPLFGDAPPLDPARDAH
ncbi:polysaccharide deacetylase family protein [Cohnella nanjingensis]|uniref:Polysaccharide deacetylase family protein n=1 Tax=Cohnella nanjingensis TaxID=1387779 RepID=A0A7X0VHW3_9BACL|nr:polysaccharide deacetylase family protein [Cohnella nanjingensis]MBB6673913.1 polysaccharide deacetylase family protein [Cohnella nanjingensis]